MNASGRARIETEVIDLSVLIETGLKGVTAVLGVTERGRTDKSILVGSWSEYVRHFGGLLDNNKFPLLCRRALERGGKLRIGRVAHFTNVADKTTIVGSLATVTYLTGVVFDAKNIGAWGNGLSVNCLPAADGTPNAVDITISLAGYPDLTQTITNISKTLTAIDINTFNTTCLLASIRPSSVADVIDTTTGVKLFAGGVQDMSLIVQADYIGDTIGSTGIHIFDNDNDFVRIAVPEMCIKDIDVALVNYVEMRKDCRAILRTPTGVDGLGAIAYRDTSPINSWYASMIYGGLEVLDPKNSGHIITPASADVLGAMAQKDNTAYEWFSTAGSKRGRLKNVLGVEYNLGTAAKATEFDQLVNKGINAVIDDKDFGPVYWGNRTMFKGNTLLRYENVADLLIFIVRSVSPLIKTELFDPNDLESWKNIYRRVRPLLELVKNRRGIWGYLYQGDQLIDNIGQAQVNTSADIDAGKYTFYLWIQPKVSMEYVGVKVVVTNSGVSFEELTGQPAGAI